MPTFSNHSLQQLCTLDPRLQRVLIQAIVTAGKDEDFTILEGYRNATRQNALYQQGLTNAQYPNGNHNSQPATACDIAPHPRPDWNDEPRFERLARRIQKIGKSMGYTIAWGGDWKAKFMGKRDIAHIELAN